MSSDKDEVGAVFVSPIVADWLLQNTVPETPVASQIEVHVGCPYGTEDHVQSLSCVSGTHFSTAHPGVEIKIMNKIK